MHYLIPIPAKSGLRDTIQRMVTRWEKPRKRRGEVFCLREEDWGCVSGWEEEANSPLWLRSVIPVRHPLWKWHGEDFLNISDIPTYMLSVHLHLWPFVLLVVWAWWHEPLGTVHGFNFFPFPRHNGGQVLAVSQPVHCVRMKQWRRCLTREPDNKANERLSVPTLESAWSRVTERETDTEKQLIMLLSCYQWSKCHFLNGEYAMSRKKIFLWGTQKHKMEIHKKIFASSHPWGLNVIFLPATLQTGNLIYQVNFSWSSQHWNSTCLVFWGFIRWSADQHQSPKENLMYFGSSWQDTFSCFHMKPQQRDNLWII